MRILLLDSDPLALRCCRHALELLGDEVQPAADLAEARRILAHGDPALAIVELTREAQDGADAVRLIHGLRPALPIIAILGTATAELAAQAIADGAADVLARPCDPLRLLAAVGRLAGRTAETIRVEPGAPSGSGMAGASPAMHEVFRDLARATADGAVTLIAGPSGVGKSLAAWMLHRHAQRRSGPFRSCDLRSIPPSDLGDEAAVGELLVGGAEGGTLVIDGATRLPPGVLDRLAALAAVRVVLIADTAPDGRLDPGWVRRTAAAHRIVIPALHGRPEDLAPISRQLLQGQADRLGRPLELATATLHVMAAHAWPGNVRELADRLAVAAERALDGVIQPGHLALRPAAAAGEDHLRTLADACLDQQAGGAYGRWLDRLDAILFARALERSRGNQLQAAARLGVNRGTLRKRCRELSVTAGG